MKQVIAAVISNDRVMPGSHLIWLDCPQIATQAWPGQFVMVRCGEDLEYPLRRPLSIHQLDGERLALLFNVVRRGTQWLSECQAGSELDLLGPLGNGFTIQSNSKKLLLVAGGIGIAPLVFLTQEAAKQEKNVMFLVGMATATQLVINDLLPRGIKYATATEDGTAGLLGLATDLLPDKDYISWADQVFACGPMPMYQTMARMPELSNKPVQISLEVRMGCGLGVCYGCTVKTKSGLRQVCQDGPIFDLDDILWEELKGV